MGWYDKFFHSFYVPYSIIPPFQMGNMNQAPQEAHNFKESY
jgi:hypothetical protein